MNKKNLDFLILLLEDISEGKFIELDVDKILNLATYRFDKEGKERDLQELVKGQIEFNKIKK